MYVSMNEQRGKRRRHRPNATAAGSTIPTALQDGTCDVFTDTNGDITIKLPPSSTPIRNRATYTLVKNGSTMQYTIFCEIPSNTTTQMSLDLFDESLHEVEEQLASSAIVYNSKRLTKTNEANYPHHIVTLLRDLQQIPTPTVPVETRSALPNTTTSQQQPRLLRNPFSSDDDDIDAGVAGAPNVESVSLLQDDFSMMFSDNEGMIPEPQEPTPVQHVRRRHLNRTISSSSSEDETNVNEPLNENTERVTRVVSDTTTDDGRNESDADSLIEPPQWNLSPPDDSENNESDDNRSGLTPGQDGPLRSLSSASSDLEPAPTLETMMSELQRRYTDVIAQQQCIVSYNVQQIMQSMAHDDYDSNIYVNTGKDDLYGFKSMITEDKVLTEAKYGNIIYSNGNSIVCMAYYSDPDDNLIHTELMHHIKSHVNPMEVFLMTCIKMMLRLRHDEHIILCNEDAPSSHVYDRLQHTKPEFNTLRQLTILGHCSQHRRPSHERRQTLAELDIRVYEDGIPVGRNTVQSPPSSTATWIIVHIIPHQSFIAKALLQQCSGLTDIREEEPVHLFVILGHNELDIINQIQYLLYTKRYTIVALPRIDISHRLDCFFTDEEYENIFYVYNAIITTQRVKDEPMIQLNYDYNVHKNYTRKNHAVLRELLAT